jgi:hypothetical protein
LHAAWQAAHKEDTVGRYIASFAALSRQQKLDVCAQCHSGGHASELRSLFRFKPGDTLSNFVFVDPRFAGGAATMDVHGNQYELLVASKCYIRSSTLECGSCHDPHVRERDQLTLFAAKCTNCHGMGNVIRGHAGIGAKYGVIGEKGRVDSLFLLTNCIDCHMPAKASEAITLMTQQQRDPVADLVRTHLITIYPDAAKGRWEAGAKRQ